MSEIRKAIAIFAVLLCVGARAQHVHVRDAGEHEHDYAGEHDHGGHTYGDEREKVVYDFTGLVPRFAVSWQTEFYTEVGLSLDIYRIGYTEASEYVSFGYRNIRPYVSGEIMMRGDKTVGGVKAGTEFIMSTNVFGMAVGGDFSWYTDGQRDAMAFTPRLMLSFVYVEAYYGYNIFILNDLRRYLGPHRIGVSCTLSPRFWKRKKRTYDDYYKSYL